MVPKRVRLTLRSVDGRHAYLKVPGRLFDLRVPFSRKGGLNFRGNARLTHHGIVPSNVAELNRQTKAAIKKGPKQQTKGW